MDEAPVTFIRESTRNLLKLNRKTLRDEESDARRLVENKSISSQQISGIANKLKSKSLASTQELQILKNALIDDKKNLDLVFSTQGALRGLVRELTGPDVKKQCVAAGCLCNLALGDSKSCGAVSKAAGSYLVAALGSLNVELAGTCAWTIGNMAGSGPRICDLLAAQGAVTKLVELLHGCEDTREAALYALVHFVYQMKDGLRVEHLEIMCEAVSKLEFSMASSQLLFLLSCHDYFATNEFPEPFLLKLLKVTTVSIEKHVSTCQQKQCCELVYLLRSLANMVINEKYSSLILNYFMLENVYKLCFSKILQSENKILAESLLWLLGVMYKYCNQKEFFHQLLEVS